MDVNLQDKGATWTPVFLLIWNWRNTDVLNCLRQMSYILTISQRTHFIPATSTLSPGIWEPPKNHLNVNMPWLGKEIQSCAKYSAEMSGMQK